MSRKNSCNNNIQQLKYKVEDICAGLKCSNIPTTILKVRYIDKTGYFCQKCSSELLRLELAEDISKGEILNV